MYFDGAQPGRFSAIRCIILHQICILDDTKSNILPLKVAVQFEMPLTFHAYWTRVISIVAFFFRVHTSTLELGISRLFNLNTKNKFHTQKCISQFPPTLLCYVRCVKFRELARKQLRLLGNSIHLGRSEYWGFGYCSLLYANTEKGKINSP